MTAGGPRVVLSAANPGAASLIGIALEALVADPEITVAGVVAQPPACDLLGPACARHGVPCLTLDAARFETGNAAAERSLLGALQIAVAPLAPDVVLTGLSGPDLGVDEGLVHLARLSGWAAYSIQDAPGWVVPGISGPATTMFVQDPALIRQTETAPGISRAVPVGALKLLSFTADAQARAAAATRRAGVTFIGQPLWHLPGYAKTLRGLSGALREAGLGPLFYRPHPLEDPEVLADLRDTGLQLDDSASFEEALMARDVVASCFSTALQDAAQLAALTGKPCPRLLYCLNQDDICAAFVAASQPLDRTQAEQPFASFLLEQPTPDGLRAVLKGGPGPQLRFASPCPARIARTILDHWTAARFLPQNYAADTSLAGNRTAEPTDSGDDFDPIPGLSAILDDIGRCCTPLRQVIPPQGGNHYLRTELEGLGAVFLKTIHAEQAARLGAAMRIETAVAADCVHVAAPLMPAPVPLEGSDRCVAVWPWLEARPLDNAATEDLHATGAALGRLHESLRRVDVPTDFARARVAWLLQGWQRLREEAQEGLLGRFYERFPWLEMALTVVSRGISDDFLRAPRQLVHGDLNPGNLMCLPGPKVVFIDFEEAVQSHLPVFFDLAMLIERQLMTRSAPGAWQPGAAVVLEAYIAETGTRLPYAACLFDARCFSILRSLTILIASERAGRPWPDSEWHKFDALTRSVVAQEAEMATFSEAYL